MRLYQHMNANPLTANKVNLLHNPEYIAQEKLKGIRCFMYVGKTHSLLQTRGGHFVDKNFQHLASITSDTPFVLDGELYAEGYEDEVVAGWANSRYLIDDTSCVKFHAFDCVDYNDQSLMDTELRIRLGILKDLELGSPNIVKVPYVSIFDAMNLYDQVLSNGGEGIMLKNLRETYKEAKRPQNNWYKLKGVSHYDVVICGYLPGQGKYEGLIGSLTYGFYIDGEVRPVGNVSGFDDALRAQLTHNFKDYMGQVIEVRAAGMNAASKALIEPRFIRFRNDKEATQCLIDQM